MLRNKYISKVQWFHSPTGKNYLPGDTVDLPEEQITEMLSKGMIVAEMVEYKKKVETETIGPEEFADIKPDKKNKK